MLSVVKKRMRYDPKSNWAEVLSIWWLVAWRGTILFFIVALLLGSEPNLIH